MPLNPLLGAGREPQTRGTITSYRIKQDSTGLASNDNFPGTVETLALTPGERVFNVQIKVFSTSVGGSIDSARFRVRINQYVIADYKLPSDSDWVSDINDNLTADLLIDGNYNLIVEYGPELADATGYNFGFSVTVLTSTY